LALQTDWNDGIAVCNLVKSLGGPVPGFKNLTRNPEDWEKNLDLGNLFKSPSNIFIFQRTSSGTFEIRGRWFFLSGGVQCCLIDLYQPFNREGGQSMNSVRDLSETETDSGRFILEKQDRGGSGQRKVVQTNKIRVKR
jgi:hypothetical protein